MGRNTTAVDTTAQGTLAVSAQARLEAFGQMLTSIPMREGDAESLLLDILNVGDWTDWQEQGQKLPSAKDYVGRELHVVRIERGESELDPDNPFFLFLHCVDRNGEPFLVTAGSQGIVARLVMLHHWGKLPAVIRIKEVGKAKPGQNRALDCDVEAVNG